MGEQFEVDALAARTDAVLRWPARAVSADAAGNVRAGVELPGGLEAAEQFATGRVAAVLQQAAGSDLELKGGPEAGEEVRRGAGRPRPASGGDGEAEGVAGRPGGESVLGTYLCFVRGDWDRGLPHLAAGSDAALAATAKHDLARPQDAAARAAAGDAWWGLAGTGARRPRQGRRPPPGGGLVSQGAARRHGAGADSIRKKVWKAARIEDEPRLTVYRYVGEMRSNVYPVTDADVPDELAVTQKGGELHISGTNAPTPKRSTESLVGDFGKVATLTGHEAGGTLQVQATVDDNSVGYRAVLMNKAGKVQEKELHVQRGADLHLVGVAAGGPDRLRVQGQGFGPGDADDAGGGVRVVRRRRGPASARRLARPAPRLRLTSGAGGCGGGAMDYLTIYAMFKRETPWLAEWIEYHRVVGVERFYLFEAEPTDEAAGVLRPYEQCGLIRVMRGGEYTHATRVGLDGACVREAESRCVWAAFIDLDEFLFPVEGDSVAALLPQYEESAALCVNWQLLGSSCLSVGRRRPWSRSSGGPRTASASTGRQVDRPPAPRLALHDAPQRPPPRRPPCGERGGGRGLRPLLRFHGPSRAAESLWRPVPRGLRR